MGSQKDKYDLRQLSQSGKFGFETFQNAESKLYYFHFNDMKGNAAVYSQGYQTMKSRDTGLQSVLKNAGNPDRYLKEVIDNKGHYFILKSGNHQQIARSRNFERLSEMNDFLDIFSTIKTDVPVHKPAISSKLEKAKKNTSKTKQKADDKKVSEKMPRHSFRLTMYPKSLSGKIVHVFTGDEQSFKGVNGEAITSFIKSHLPKEAVATKEVPKPKSVKLPLQSIQLEEEIKNITIKKGLDPIRYSIENTLPYNVEFKVESAACKTDETVSFHAKITAKSLKSNHQIIVGELCKELEKDGNISVPVLFNTLDPGIYRLLTSVTLNEAQTLNGSRLIQVTSV